MEDSSKLKRIVPVSRRNVLKAGAVTAAGAGLFSGIASATNPKQINFCGCSQVCVDRAPHDTKDRDVGGTFHVIVAKEDGEGGWEFGSMSFGDDTEEEFQDFCFEPGDPYKIIAVRPGDSTEVYCNPGQCAQKALAAYLNETGFSCVNDDFGTFLDTASDEEGDSVEIVQGRCGQAGRTPPGQENDR